MQKVAPASVRSADDVRLGDSHGLARIPYWKEIWGATIRSRQRQDARVIRLIIVLVVVVVDAC
jgi:hypothetical protein